jgi:hypothetical protein
MGARLEGANGKWPKLHVLYEQLCGPLPEDTRLHNADTDAHLCANIYEKLMNYSPSYNPSVADGDPAA